MSDRSQSKEKVDEVRVRSFFNADEKCQVASKEHERAQTSYRALTPKASCWPAAIHFQCRLALMYEEKIDSKDLCVRGT